VSESSPAVILASPQPIAAPGARALDLNRLLLGAAALAAMALAVFWPALHGKFIWDDYVLIVNNDTIHAADGLRRFWFSTEPWDYFPLTNSVFWIEWRLFGDNTLGYHLVSLALHMGSGIFIWRSLRRLRAPFPWICAALFIVHPVNVESVSWIAELKNTLSLFLCMVAGYAYVRFDEGGQARRRWYGLALVTFLAALLAKTSVVPFPFALLALPWLRRGRIARSEALASAPFFVISLALALATMWFQSHRAIGGAQVRTDGMASRLAVAGCAVWFYFGKVLWPANCMFVYPRWNLNPHDPINYLPGALVVVTLTSLFLLRKRLGRGPIFAAGYYVLMLLPILGFVNVFFMWYSLVSDHWQYPAVIAGIALAVGAIARLLAPLGERLTIGLLAVGIGACMFISNSNAGAYAGPETLWVDAVRRDPGSWMPHRQVAVLLTKAGANQAAMDELMTAYHLNPEVADTSLTIGVQIQIDGNPQAAMPWYRQGLANLPTGDDPRMRILRASALFDLGWGYDGCGQPEQAMDYYRQAIALDPENVQALGNLGLLLFKSGKIDEAIAQYQSALAADPDLVSARIDLGQALLARGQTDAAIAQWKIAIADDPENFKAMNNLGAALAQHGDLKDAIAMFQAAIKVAPYFPDAQQNLRRAEAQLARRSTTKSSAS
jgi:protein O-mannosyl-transferase